MKFTLMSAFAAFTLLQLVAAHPPEVFPEGTNPPPGASGVNLHRTNSGNLEAQKLIGKNDMPETHKNTATAEKKGVADVPTEPRNPSEVASNRGKQQRAGEKSNRKNSGDWLDEKPMASDKIKGKDTKPSDAQLRYMPPPEQREEAQISKKANDLHRDGKVDQTRTKTNKKRSVRLANRRRAVRFTV